MGLGGRGNLDRIRYTGIKIKRGVRIILKIAAHFTRTHEG